MTINLPSNPTIKDLISALYQFNTNRLIYVDWDGTVSPPSVINELGEDIVIE